MCPMLQTKKRSLERSHDPRITTSDRDPKGGAQSLATGTFAPDPGTPQRFPEAGWDGSLGPAPAQAFPGILEDQP